MGACCALLAPKPLWCKLRSSSRVPALPLQASKALDYSWLLTEFPHSIPSWAKIPQVTWARSCINEGPKEHVNTSNAGICDQSRVRESGRMSKGLIGTLTFCPKQQAPLLSAQHFYISHPQKYGRTLTEAVVRRGVPPHHSLWTFIVKDLWKIVENRPSRLETLARQGQGKRRQ